MGEKILFCADNLFSDVLYPGHVVSADEQATGFEVWNVANGRRQAGDRWQPTTANVDHNVKSVCDQLRSADFLAVDRASNWRGRRLVLESSANDFAAPGGATVVDVTIPTGLGGSPSGALGCVTDELAWWKLFSFDAAQYWRTVFKAAGAGVTPQISGLFLGKAWQPTEAQLFFPVDDEGYRVQFNETTSPYGWVGRTRPAVFRHGMLVVKPATDLDYDFIRWQVLGLFAAGFPAWICHDRVDGGRRALLARCPSGDIDWGRKRDWPTRGINIPFIEEQVAL